MGPDEPNDEEAIEKLPEDYNTPFSPPDETSRDPAATFEDAATQRSSLDDTHPATDSNIEREEVYDAGLETAASVDEEPNAGNTVVDWHKPKQTETDDDDRRHTG